MKEYMRKINPYHYDEEHSAGHHQLYGGHSSIVPPNLHLHHQHSSTHQQHPHRGRMVLCTQSLILLLFITQINVWMLFFVVETPLALVQRIGAGMADRSNQNQNQNPHQHQSKPSSSSSTGSSSSSSNPWWQKLSNFWHGKPHSLDDTPAYFQAHSHEQLQKFIQADTILSWTKTTDKFFEELNVTAVLTPDVLPVVKLHGRPTEEKLAVWRDTHSSSFIWEANICFAARNFLKTGGVKPHVLFTYLNENRGAFSMDVPNRTVEWNALATHWDKWGCTDEEIWAYLDNENTRAVFTTQHQSYSHPKVHSVPLGVYPFIKDKITRTIPLPRKNRTQLLMINDNGWRHRANVTQAVMATFAKSGFLLKNTYSKESGSASAYIEELRVSKFILAPSGLGWDCYRIWEALNMGVIPIIETFDRPVDAWRDTLEGLPVLWVNHYEQVTPELLEEEYVRIAARAEDYNYEKLTKGWWIDYFRSFVPEDTTTAKAMDQPKVGSSLESSSHLLRYYYDRQRPNEIPRILHFVYVTPGLPESQAPLPPEVQDQVDGWHRLHPDWMVMLWDNTALRQEFPELATFVEPIQTMSWISNLLRYHALEKYGGVYLDVDIAPIHSIEPLRRRFPSFTACESPESTGPLHNESEYAINFCEMANNNVIGVPRHHPALKDIIHLAMTNTRVKLRDFPNDGGRYELKTTGPPVWSKSAKQFDLTILHPSLFYPCNWNRKENCRLELWNEEPHVYGMHQWKMTWLKR